MDIRLFFQHCWGPKKGLHLRMLFCSSTPHGLNYHCGFSEFRMEDNIFPHKEILLFINDTLDMKQFTLQVCRSLKTRQIGNRSLILCTLYSTKLINTYVLGPEESHRKLRPNVLREDSTRTGLRYQLDSCPIYGAHGLPWSPRGTWSPSNRSCQFVFCLA